jgi:hypothetical protein
MKSERPTTAMNGSRAIGLNSAGEVVHETVNINSFFHDNESGDGSGLTDGNAQTATVW